MKILFWNIDKNPQKEQIIDLIITEDPDCFLLIEADLVDVTAIILECESFGVKLKAISFGNSYAATLPQSIKFQLLYKDSLDIKQVKAGIKSRCFYLTLNYSDLKLLLVPVHLPSKITANRDINRIDEFYDAFIRQLHAVEEALPEYQTVVFGDFNLNPYEEEMMFSTRLFSERCPELSLQDENFEEIGRAHV